MIITSFKKSVNYKGRKFSAAVYQPSGYDYPEIKWMKITEANGKWIRPREFVKPGMKNPLIPYTNALWNLYTSRQLAVVAWKTELRENDVICCWCPYERAAQRQMKEFGTFVCHTSVIALFLSQFGVNITFDSDRIMRMWKPTMDMIRE